MSLNELEVVVDEDGGVTVSPSVVARLGAKPGEHLQLVRSGSASQSRPKRVRGILVGKVDPSELLTEEDFAVAKAERIEAVERRFRPPQ